MIRPGFALSTWLAALAIGVSVAPSPTAAVASSVPLRERVAQAVAAHAGKNRVGVGVWDAATGEAVLRRNADVLLRPASVMKLWTTGAALLTLGPDHELATEVLVRGGVAEGRLDGDLWVRGEGDPGLCARFHDGDAEAALRGLAEDVRAAGIERVAGDLVLDDRAIPDPGRPDAWEWKDGDTKWYGAPISALTLNDGCIDVTVTPGPKVGAPAVVRVAPRTDLVSFDNRLVTTASRDAHSIAFGPPAANGRMRAFGKVWKGSHGYTAPLACVEPRAFFADVFLRLLSEAGVTVDGEVRAPAAGERPKLRRVGRHATSVAQIVDVVNTSSQNLYAELLLRAVGRDIGGDGSAAAGIRRGRDALEIAAADRTVHQVDGCGLARANGVTADAAGRLLVKMFGSPHRLAFMDSLARPGRKPGTLRSRFKQTRFKGRLLAKTGTLRDTTALAGYVRAPDGNVYAFAVLVEGDGTSGKRLQRAVVDALVRE